MRRMLKYLALLACGCLLFVDGTNAALASCQATTALTSINFCFVFDCANGAFGGLIEFCGDQVGENVFLDCPTPP